MIGSCFPPHKFNYFLFSIFRSALSRLGIDSRTCGFWSHDIVTFAHEIAPKSILVDVVYNQMKTINTKALKKKQQAEKQK